MNRTEELLIRAWEREEKLHRIGMRWLNFSAVSLLLNVLLFFLVLWLLWRDQ